MELGLFKVHGLMFKSNEKFQENKGKNSKIFSLFGIGGKCETRNHTIIYLFST